MAEIVDGYALEPHRLTVVVACPGCEHRFQVEASGEWDSNLALRVTSLDVEAAAVKG